MSQVVSPIPVGHHTLTPHLIVRSSAEAVRFYESAFGAVELGRQMMAGTGKVLHCALEVGDSRLFLVDEFPEWGALGPQEGGSSAVSIHMYVEDVDASFARAVEAGAEVVMPLMDTFWGDRYGKLRDPFGHVWSMASRIEDLTPEEIDRRASSFFASADQGEGASVCGNES